MIHQHILASPKPGMSEDEFQSYWLNVHAVKFASKIKQIKRYKVDCRIDWAGQEGSPLWGGMAEIWLKNEEEQLASLQSPEFLDGARLDEPKWAAFWNTQVLDTDAHYIMGSENLSHDSEPVKLFVLLKRAPGLDIDEFRSGVLDAMKENTSAISDMLTEAVLCTTRDSWYVVGEPRFDAALHLTFADVEQLNAAFQSHPNRLILEAPALLEPRYTFPMAFKEHWVIGPQERE